MNDPMRKWANELSRVFSKEKVQKKKNHEEVLNVPGPKGNKNQNQVKIKTILTPGRMAIIKNTNNSKYWQGNGEKGNLIHCW
jgi:hypothetical protein